MSDIRVAHRDLIANLRELNNFGKQRAAAALFAGDLDRNLRVDPSELASVMRAVAIDPQLDQRARYAVINAIQEAFTRLGSPAQCARGVPHQKMVDNLEELNAFGKQRAAAALSSGDFDRDLCVTSTEVASVIRAVNIDPQLDQRARYAVGNNIQLAFTRLSPPKCTAGGVNARCNGFVKAPATLVTE